MAFSRFPSEQEVMFCQQPSQQREKQVTHMVSARASPIGCCYPQVDSVISLHLVYYQLTCISFLNCREGSLFHGSSFMLPESEDVQKGCFCVDGRRGGTCRSYRDGSMWLVQLEPGCGWVGACVSGWALNHIVDTGCRPARQIFTLPGRFWWKFNLFQIIILYRVQ